MNSAEYHRLAAVEDQMWYFRAAHAHVARELAGALAATASARVLDAGCGTGGLLRRLQPRWPLVRWSGVDVSAVACGLARVRAPAAAIQEASVTALPFGERQFDAVISVDVLYHVEDDRQALREFARVLRPGGLAILNVPAYEWLWSYHDVATAAVRRYGRRALLDRVGEAGLTVQRWTHWNSLPLPMIVLRRKLWPAPREGSDVALMPAPVECLLRGLMGLEQGWLRAGGRLPCGSSLLVVAQKPA